MDTVVISKSEYKKIQREQKRLRSELSELTEIIKKFAEEELSSSAIRRLSERSKRTDEGVGIRFRSALDVKRHLKQM